MNSLLLHSVSYAGLWGQAFLSVDEVVDKAASLGFDGVMLMAKRPHLSVLDYGPAERAALRSRMEARGLRDLCLAGYCNLTADLEHADIPQRELQVVYLTELARLAHDLDGSLVRVFTGYESPAAGLTQQWKLIVESLREASKRASDFGVTLGVQNHHDIAVGYQSLHDLVTAVNQPNCKALFDAWAPALHGDDLAEAARLLAPQTVHTTIADYQLRPRFKYNPAILNYEAQKPSVVAVPMGEGFIDYATFLATLRAGGFQGSIAYEMCSPLRDALGGDAGIETLDRYAGRFLEWIASQPGAPH